MVEEIKNKIGEKRPKPTGHTIDGILKNRG